MSINMNFFRSLRLLLAFNPKNTAIGGIMTDTIENYFLPKLAEDWEREPDAGKRDEIMKMIRIWTDYMDPYSNEGKSWNEEAVRVGVPVAQKAGITDDATIADMFSYVQDKIWRGKWETLLPKFRSYDYMKGPTGLLKFWKKVIANGVGDALRNSRNWRSVQELPRSKDTGEELPLEDPKSWDPSRASDKELELVAADMREWVTGKLGKSDKTLYKIWEKVAEKQHRGEWHKVDFQEEVLPAYRDITRNEQSAMYAGVKKIQKLIMKYYQDRFDRTPTRRELQNLKLAQRVAVAYWMPRFAAWMLELAVQRRKFLNAL